MILLYNTNHTQNPNAYLTLAVIAALKELVGPQGVRLVDERSIASAAAAGDVRLLICIDGQRLNAGLLARVRPAVRCMVLWAFEDPFMLDYNLSSLDLFDMVFTNDPSCVDAYRGKGEFLPLGGSPELQHRPVRPDADLDYDVFFAGTMWPNRVSLLRRIIGAFPDARLKLVCPTNPYLPPLPSIIAERAITRPISHEAFIDFANTSRVSLTLFRDYPSHGSRGLATGPGPRLYELALSGTAQVVHRDPRVPEAQLAGLDGVIVSSGDLLVQRIGEILGDPARRDDLAVRAQRSASARHLYRHRLVRLLDRALPDWADGGPAASAAPTSARAVISTDALPKLRVLMCTHSTIYNEVWGGVEVYQQMLAGLLDREVEVFYWIRRDGSCQLLNRSGKVLERFEAPDIGWLDVLCDPFEETNFSSVLSSYEIDIVHFQHLGHHAASLPIIAKACGVGTVFSVHDFFLVCSRYNLLDDEQKFCDIGHRPITACSVCLARAEGLPATVQQQRRGFIEQILGAVDLLLFGSTQSEELVLRIYPQAQAIRRVVIGVPAPAVPLRHAKPAPRPDRNSDVLDVMIVGNFLHTKGAETVLKVIDAARPDLFRFHILGMAEARYLPVLERLVTRNVTYSGRYAPGDLSLSGGQVALHLSIWPETWCISLSEVWQAGLIPIVSDIGALGERVTHGRNGFKVAVGDAAAVLDLLETLRGNAGLRDTLRANIGPHLWIDQAPYAAMLLAEYRALAPKVPLGREQPDRLLRLDVGQLHLLPQRSWKQLPAPRHILDALPVASFAIELPPSIREWSSIQRCRSYVDRVCDVETDPLHDFSSDTQVAGELNAIDGFSIEGWVFEPGASMGGQLFVALINRTAPTVVFIEAVRSARADVQARLPDAPLHSGYHADVKLLGKWSDGIHDIGLITVINGRAAFHLPGYRIWLVAGMVTQMATLKPDEDTIIQAFARVFASAPERLAPGRIAEPRDFVHMPDERAHDAEARIDRPAARRIRSRRSEKTADR